MANKQCVTRLQKEYKTLLKEPVPQVTAHPSPSNLLEWHFVLEGSASTEFAGGAYHGKITFPAEYPFKPPSLSLYTPNGRFAVNTKLCLSMTDYHPESWNPMWSVGTILTGLLSFMHDNQATTGSITTTRAEKEQLAADSLAFNMKNPMFRKLFPDWVQRHEARLQGLPDAPLGAASVASSTPAAAAGLPAGPQAPLGAAPEHAGGTGNQQPAVAAGAAAVQAVQGPGLVGGGAGDPGIPGAATGQPAGTWAAAAGAGRVAEKRAAADAWQVPRGVWVVAGAALLVACFMAPWMQSSRMAT